MHELTCDEVLDSAPQFALDILEPARRSQVAAHIVRCPGCRAEVTGMQESAAALLDLDGADWSGAARPAPDPPLWDAGPDRPWPPADQPWPPAGGPPRPGRRRLRVMVTLAAAALLMVGSTFGPEIEAASTRPPTPVARAQLLDGTRPVGFVDFYSGTGPALALQVVGVTARGQAEFETVGVDGTVTRLGSFALSDGRGYWARRSPIDMAQVSSLMVVDDRGRVLASASLAAAVS